MSIIKAEEYSESNSVLSDTFKLTSIALAFSFFVGFISNIAGLTPLLSNLWVSLPLFLVALFMVFYITKNQTSKKGLYGIFGFAGIYGLLLDPVISTATKTDPGAVTVSLITTSIITFVMSYIGKNTKKDLSSMGMYLFVGLIAILIAMIINIFLGSTLLMMIISSIAALIFSLYIMYDVNQIVTGGERNYISATLSMYLNIIGLFLHTLNILTSVDD